MDWNTIYEAIAPYLGTTTIAIGLIAVFAAIIKFDFFYETGKSGFV